MLWHCSGKTGNNIRINLLSIDCITFPQYFPRVVSENVLWQMSWVVPQLEDRACMHLLWTFLLWPAVYVLPKQRPYMQDICIYNSSVEAASLELFTLATSPPSDVPDPCETSFWNELTLYIQVCAGKGSFIIYTSLLLLKISCPQNAFVCL